MIEVKHLYAGYDKKIILKDISFKIKEKSFVAIIGKNGAGKTTLLKVLCNLLKISSGFISLYSKTYDCYKLKEFAKIVAFMPQSYESTFPFSVKDFVMFGRYPYMNALKIATNYDKQIVENVLKLANVYHLRNRNINELSGGEKQKVLIAQTLAQETKIIVLDEPISHLDIGSQAEILDLLKELNTKYNKTIISTLHDLNSASSYCDNLILLDDGKIYKNGTPGEVLNYQDIEKIYKTTVLIKENPLSKKPYVIQIPKHDLEKNGRK